METGGSVNVVDDDSTGARRDLRRVHQLRCKTLKYGEILEAGG
jgi:hypothetical protein